MSEKETSNNASNNNDCEIIEEQLEYIDDCVAGSKAAGMIACGFTEGKFLACLYAMNKALLPFYAAMAALKQDLKNQFKDLKCKPEKIDTTGIQKSLNKFNKDFPKHSEEMGDGLKQTINNAKSTGDLAEKSAGVFEEAVVSLAEAEEIFVQVSSDVYGEIVRKNFISSSVPPNYAQVPELYHNLKNIGLNPTKKDFVYSPVIDAGNTKEELRDALNKSTLEYISLLNKRSA